MGILDMFSFYTLKPSDDFLLIASSWGPCFHVVQCLYIFSSWNPNRKFKVVGSSPLYFHQAVCQWQFAQLMGLNFCHCYKVPTAYLLGMNTGKTWKGNVSQDAMVGFYRLKLSDEILLISSRRDPSFHVVQCLFFSSWNQNRKQVVSSPRHCHGGLLVAICTNIFGTQFLQSLDGAYMNSGKTKKGKCFPRFFYNRNFKGEEELSYLGTVILIPFHGSRYFCTNSLAKYDASCPSSKEEEPTHFSLLQTWQLFTVSSFLNCTIVEKIRWLFSFKDRLFFALKIYFHFHELNAHFTFFA